MHPGQDEPLFLGRSGGLTRNPAKALRMNRRVELEPVDEATQARFADGARRDQVVAR